MTMLIANRSAWSQIPASERPDAENCSVGNKARFAIRNNRTHVITPQMAQHYMSPAELVFGDPMMPQT
jgi:hypothetical protein